MTHSAAAETAVALFLGLILVTLGAVFTEPGAAQPDLRPSTYVDDPTGLRALHELLLAVGARPERLLDDPTQLTERDQTLVVAGPSEPFSDHERDALFDWVAAGGRLVVAAALEVPPLRRSFHDDLIVPLGVRARRRARPARAAKIDPSSALDATLALDWRASLVIEEIEQDDDGEPDSDRPSDASGHEKAARRDAIVDPRAGTPRPVIRTRSHTLVTAIPFGDAGGEVIVLADETLLTNRTLRKKENAVAVVQLLLAREGDEGRVLFDEFHHGFRIYGERADLMQQAKAMLFTTWPGRGVLLLVFAWFVLLAGAGVRLGKPLPDTPPPRRRLSEHADALGRLLESARARAEALRVLAAGTRRVVGPRAGLSSNLSPRVFAERLAASPAPGAEELAATLVEADRIRPERDADLARVSRELAAARRRYLHGGI